MCYVALFMSQKRLYQLGDTVKLFGKESVIDDCIYKGWTGYHYKIVGDKKWYHQNCFSL